MGELARQPGCPGLSATPLELLEPRPNEGVLLKELNKWSWPLIGGAGGLFTAILRNKILFRPTWAGIQFHLFMTVGTAALMVYIRDVRYAARAEADEVYKDYINLHPEDFPPFERKRYRDVYERFIPTR